MTERVDAIVVGAGVVGLAVARALSVAGRSVVVVERREAIGTETSSRNSGVIHSGIYYKTESHKARLCVRGRELLYDYCEKKGISYRRCGKLIVAHASKLSSLEALQSTAKKNGVDNLVWLDAAGVRHLEPKIQADAGLWCPDTGIISVHELLLAMQGDIEDSGGNVVLLTEFVRSTAVPDGFQVELQSGVDQYRLSCGILINAAGLMAAEILSRIEPYSPHLIPRMNFAKGNYFEYAGRSPFRHLVYPMPSEAGLGVHGTLDLAGRLRFGPDVEWLHRAAGGAPDYKVDPARARAFYSAIREYWPDLPDGSLIPSYAGIRPKLVGPGLPAADFLIQGQVEHGLAGFVALLGIESPGMTAALAIGEAVERAVSQQ